jgi:phosphohistidine phosphatase
VSLRLLLVRHAKAVPAALGLGDRDRPLTEGGRRAAVDLGRRLAEAGFVPQLILCSDAARARETAQLASGTWRQSPELRTLPQLYERTDADYLDLVRTEPNRASCVMLVAHNPAVHATALALLDAAGAGAGELRRHYPTSATAVLDFDAADWAAVRLGSGRLAAYLLPHE